MAKRIVTRNRLDYASALTRDPLEVWWIDSPIRIGLEMSASYAKSLRAGAQAAFESCTDPPTDNDEVEISVDLPIKLVLSRAKAKSLLDAIATELGRSPPVSR